MTVFDYSIFESTIQKILSESTSRKNLAKSTVLITSSLSSLDWNGDEVDGHFDTKIILLNKKKDNLIKLALLSYEINENLGFYLRQAIDAVCAQRPEYQDVKFIITNKINRNLWLNQHFAGLTGHQIFGNFFNKNQWNEVLASFKVKKLRNHSRPTDTKPTKRTIGVGYRDKGTLPIYHGVGSYQNFSDSSKQVEIEQNREKADDLYKILEGFFW